MSKLHAYVAALMHEMHDWTRNSGRSHCACLRFDHASYFHSVYCVVRVILCSSKFPYLMNERSNHVISVAIVCFLYTVTSHMLNMVATLDRTSNSPNITHAYWNPRCAFYRMRKALQLLNCGFSKISANLILRFEFSKPYPIGPVQIT